MYQKILQELEPYGARLIAVTKTKPEEAILDLYAQGQRDFGENRVQELLPKYKNLPKDIRWHLIGHLQRNKVKYIAPFVHLIHSVDSMELLQEIDKQARKHDRVIDCLLQFHIAQEETKFGLQLEEVLNWPQEGLEKLDAVRLCGVMGMATFTDDETQVRAEFVHLRNIFDAIKGRFFAGTAYFREISMGMSDDYHLALQEGSTMVRIGTLLFGERM